MTRFEIVAEPLPDLKVFQRRPLADSRGFLTRMFCKEDFEELGMIGNVSQINHTLTRTAGAVRGLHFQRPPHSETKVISCLRGAVFDVAVDIRRSSATFLRWHPELLTEDNNRSVHIPAGFAHGFQCLTPDCELLYVHSAPFESRAEGGLNILDPRLNIKWPLPVSDISERDITHDMMDDNFEGLDVS